ncbi:hypothetical protein SDC9_155606 [bioreactor metagenome]|uniref:Uncharacterized protein n=1 Tax=bioreactor metagenome TaxID=1076179 RepID=A0A645F6T2_9ZZZZ
MSTASGGGASGVGTTGRASPVPPRSATACATKPEGSGAMPLPCARCSIQTAKTRCSSSTIASSSELTAMSWRSHRFSVCSTAQAVSPKSASPTMRPEPLRVCVHRRIVVSASRSSGSFASAAFCVAISASTS